MPRRKDVGAPTDDRREACKWLRHVEMSLFWTAEENNRRDELPCPGCVVLSRVVRRRPRRSWRRSVSRSLRCARGCAAARRLERGAGAVVDATMKPRELTTFEQAALRVRHEAGRSQEHRT
jgi:hypothetical protein